MMNLLQDLATGVAPQQQSAGLGGRIGGLLGMLKGGTGDTGNPILQRMKDIGRYAHEQRWPAAQAARQFVDPQAAQAAQADERDEIIRMLLAELRGMQPPQPQPPDTYQYGVDDIDAMLSGY